MKDHVNKIPKIIRISVYRSLLMLISKRVSVDASAHEIHHHNIVHAIIQNIIDMNKLWIENRIFCSFWLCIIAIIEMSTNKDKGSIHMYSSHSE